MSLGSNSRPPEDDLALLSAYIDGELNTSEREALEARLQQDPKLQANLESLQATVMLVQSLPRLKAPRNFTLDPAQYGFNPKPRAQVTSLRRWRLVNIAGVAASIIFLMAGLLVGALQGMGDADSTVFQPISDDIGTSSDMESAENGAPPPTMQTMFMDDVTSEAAASANINATATQLLDALPTLEITATVLMEMDDAGSDTTRSASPPPSGGSGATSDNPSDDADGIDGEMDDAIAEDAGNAFDSETPREESSETESDIAADTFEGDMAESDEPQALAPTMTTIAEMPTQAALSAPAASDETDNDADMFDDDDPNTEPDPEAREDEGETQSQPTDGSEVEEGQDTSLRDGNESTSETTINDSDTNQEASEPVADDGDENDGTSNVPLSTILIAIGLVGLILSIGNWVLND